MRNVKTFTLVFTILLMLCLSACSLASTPTTEEGGGEEVIATSPETSAVDLSGTWTGDLGTIDSIYSMLFNLTQGTDGTITGDLTITGGLFDEHYNVSGTFDGAILRIMEFAINNIAQQNSQVSQSFNDFD